MNDTEKAYAVADDLILTNGKPKSDEALRTLVALAYLIGAKASYEDVTAKL